MIQIGIVGGTGAEGRGLAYRFASAGVRVLLGSRDRARATAAVGELGVDGVSAAINSEVLEACETVVIAVPFDHAVDVLSEHAGRFRPGCLLLDVTVPVVFARGGPRLAEIPEGSSAERLRRHLPGGVSLAAAFKTIPARALLEREPLDCDEFVCGDSAEARARAMALVGMIPGLRPLDAGSLEAARILERMTLLAIGLNRRYKRHGARFKVVGGGWA